MIKKYIIDGNNLIGKIGSLNSLLAKDKQAPREKLAFMLDRHFGGKKIKISLHFDGYQNLAIKTQKVKITYSDNKTADDLIKHEINVSKNPKVLAVVSSDHSVMEFAKVNACTVIKSEEFASELTSEGQSASEEEIIKSINNDEIKKLFGL